MPVAPTLIIRGLRQQVYTKKIKKPWLHLDLSPNTGKPLLITNNTLHLHVNTERTIRLQIRMITDVPYLL